jgi:beta-1,4-mannosyltransferase
MVSIVRSINVVCLPVAGKYNPYHALMIQGLNQHQHIKASNGVGDRFLGIIRTVLRYRPDYLHFDWIISYYYRRWRWLTYASVPLFMLQILLARYLFGTHIVWTLHNILPHDSDQVALHRLCQRFMARHCVWIRVFSVDSVVRAALELGVPENKLRVVPEGDYCEYYPNTVDRTQSRKHLKLSSSSRVFLYLGLIKPYKGIIELIHSFKLLNLPDSCLLIAGKVIDYRYGLAIRKILDDSVILVDQFIPEGELQYYYQAADAVVLPFKQIENSGSVILAMGYGKPIVAPALGVVKERLSQQGELLFSDHDELPQKMEQVLRLSGEEREAIGRKNQEALIRYRWEDFGKLFL